VQHKDVQTVSLTISSLLGIQLVEMSSRSF